MASQGLLLITLFVLICVAESAPGGGGHGRKCYFNGVSYGQNDRIKETCIKLDCKAEKWHTNGQTSVCCDCMYSHDDPHVAAYDGTKYPYHETGCSVTSQFGLSANSNFEVQMETHKCTNAEARSCVKSVTYCNMKEPVVQLRVKIELNELKGTWITTKNGEEFDVENQPTAYHNGPEGDASSRSFIMWKRGQCIKVFGARHDVLSVCKYHSGKRGVWGLTMTHCVPESFRNKNDIGTLIPLYGLGGKYNRDPTDDFTKSDGTLTTDVNDFGNSWAVATCPTTRSSSPVKKLKCNEETNRESLATCRKALKDTPLTDLARKTQENACVQDLCGFKAGRATEEDIDGFMEGIRAIAKEIGPVIERRELKRQGLIQREAPGVENFDKLQPACGSWTSILAYSEQQYTSP